MQEEIDLENRIREDNSQKLVRKLGDEIGKFHEMLTLERKVINLLIDNLSWEKIHRIQCLGW